MRRWRQNSWENNREHDVRHQTERVEAGIHARGNGIAETWWSKRWVAVLESFGMGTRLARGRAYARQGLVLALDILPGVVKARVQGSIDKPYEITIRLQPLTDAEWEQAIEIMAARAVFAAKLLAGEMPRDIEDAFREVRLSLFPVNEDDLQTTCSCSDWANPCKHVVAAYYILAERFDADPFLLFSLRGRSKEAIIDVLRQRRAETAPAEKPEVVATEAAGTPEEETSLLLEAYLDTFWQSGETLIDFSLHPRAQRLENAVLKRLGAAPYSVQGQDMRSLLSRAYTVVEEAALRKVMEA